MNCPLCKGINIHKLETLKFSDLIVLYQNKFQTDITHLVKEDLNYCECYNCKLRFFDPLTTGDEKFYNYLQPYDWYYVDDKEEFLIAKKYIDPGAKVLEVGSGSGTFAKHFLGSYTGLDLSPRAKEMAAKKGITIENASIQDYALSCPGEFDVVVSFQVLEHVSDPDSFLNSMIKAVKIGGKLIIAVPSEDSFIKYATNEVLNLPPHHVTRWSDEVFKFIEKTRGLRLIEIQHEDLQEAHRKFFLSTLIQSFLASPRLVDISFRRKIVAKISDVLAKLFMKRLSPEFFPAGHTVLAVFEKV